MAALCRRSRDQLRDHHLLSLVGLLGKGRTLDRTLWGGSVIVVTHFVLVGRGVTGAMVGGEVVIVTVTVFVVVAAEAEGGGSLLVGVATGLARVVWIWARLAKAVLKRSRIWSICSCSSSSSPGRGGATSTGGVVTVVEGGGTLARRGADTLEWREAEEEEEVEEAAADARIKLAKEVAAGPPFSHDLFAGPAFCLGGTSPSPLVASALASEAARRASSRRVLSVSRLKWTRLKSRASLVAARASSFTVSLFHLADPPGGGGAGGPGVFCRLQLYQKHKQDTIAMKVGGATLVTCRGGSTGWHQGPFSPVNM